MLKLLASLMLLSATSLLAQVECTVSEIKLFTQNPDPSEKSWMKADGRSLLADRYPGLYSKLLNNYGGNEVKFNLPLITSVAANDLLVDYYICVDGVALSNGHNHTITSIHQYASDRVYDQQAQVFKASNPAIFPAQNVLPFMSLTYKRFSDEKFVYMPKITLGEEVVSGLPLTTYLSYGGYYPVSESDYVCEKGEIVLNFLLNGNLPKNLREVSLSTTATIELARETEDSNRYPRAFECL